MFGIKTKIINHFKKNLENLSLNSVVSPVEKLAWSKLISQELKRESKQIDLQQPIARQSNPIAAGILRTTANYMPNNLGNWSIKKPQTLTAKAELNLIKLFRKYYQCNNIIGHFSSGSTEGNIYASWLGRNYLKQRFKLSCNQIILIKSDLAHYSIDKAADLVGVDLIRTSIDQQEFNLDLLYLQKQITKLYQKGYRGFLLPLTLGYTVTGTDDDYLAVCQFATKFMQKHKNCHFFIWLDAAFSGISKIFTEVNFKPFQHPLIQLISTDFHKFLAIPYPAALLMYRQTLLQYIQKDIPYIDQLDTTLLGSRPGINVLSSWLTLKGFGEKGIKNKIKKALEEKENFLQKLSVRNLDIKIINNKNSLQACLVNQNRNNDYMLNRKLKLKKINYKLLIGKNVKIMKMYKLYFPIRFSI